MVEENFDLEKELEENIVQTEPENIMAEETKQEQATVEQPTQQQAEQVAKAPAAEEAPVQQPKKTAANSALVEKEIADKSSEAIKSMLESIPKPQIDSPTISGVSLENIVLDALKPMLKEWLDKNLEVIVKDIVQKEIRKILPRE